ncbi:MAG: right-handed parallel beta-helix repeat-containing protein [Proteobacteria bacterium]|nr:right-handed parallel beta-helix repeat-containing protein [Pseudomonadota bacterium]MBU1686529.1 right-handed parallel beta-helix repeat-containing protein [Pseudomonadota bacterium]
MPNFFSLIILFGLLANSTASGSVLTADTLWQGKVLVEDDVIIPVGVTLSIAPGTVIRVKAADSTKIDPEFLSHETEILVRGRLIALGEMGREIVFDLESAGSEEPWAGIIVDQGEIMLSHGRVMGSEAALSVVNGRATLEDTIISKNKYGLVVQGTGAAVVLRRTTITGNDYGTLVFNGGSVEHLDDVTKGNEKNDTVTGSSTQLGLSTFIQELPEPPITASYQDQALPNFTLWKGRVLVDGQVRLPPTGRLVILPGTIVEFTKHDTNADGIGENGIQIQGQLIAKGTPDQPIIFRSVEKNPQMGDWDSLNFLGSDQSQNIVEYCRIQNAYRGMHFHYSNVAVNHVVLHDNYRGIQFQESLVAITNSRFFKNRSGIQARDSEVVLQSNEIFNNLNGANLFRLNLLASDNVFANNDWDGLRIREGTARISRNLMAGNRVGLVVADALFGNYSANVITDNLEAGLVARNNDNIEINGNAITDNGLNGMNLRDTRAVVQGNLVAHNGERGLGVMGFSGVISGNNIQNNGIYAIGLESDGDVHALDNWWGTSDLNKEIFDHKDDSSLGEVLYSPASVKPFPFSWPRQTIDGKAYWSGLIRVDTLLAVSDAAVLNVAPATVMEFTHEEAGLLVNGELHAEGLAEQRIIFTSVRRSGQKDWLGVQLERATGSTVNFATFEHAQWGLHIHFVPIDLNGCRFAGNDIGIKFRSGPMTLRRSVVTGNRIGIRSFHGKMEIAENEISGNEIGIFVREGGSGLSIHHNNLHGNSRYNLRLGDFDHEDVDARQNFWGVSDPPTTIFDGRVESFIGMVDFEPILPELLNLELNF